MCIHDPDRSPVEIHGRDTAPTLSGLAEIKSGDPALLIIQNRLRARGNRYGDAPSEKLKGPTRLT